MERLNIYTVDINKCVNSTWFYTKDDLINLRDRSKRVSLRKSIKNFGQIEPLKVRKLENEKYEIIDGNKRLEILKELNIKEIWISDFGKISEEEAIFISLVSNEVRFELDHIKRAELIEGLTKKYSKRELINKIPFTQKEIVDFEELLHFDWEDFKKSKVGELKIEKHDWMSEYVHN